MKTLPKLALVCAFIAINITAFANPVDNVNQQLTENTKEVSANKFRANANGIKSLKVPFDFANNAIVDEDAIAELYGSKIYSVTYVYSGFAVSPDFDQSALDLKRLKKLNDVLPEVFDNDAIKWQTVRLVDLEDVEAAEKVFHGYIIRYKDWQHDFSLDNIFTPNAIKSQYFTIKYPNRSFTVKGRHGTYISIPPNAFVDADGNPVKTPIKIELKEVVTKEAMVVSGLATITTNDEILESRGMVYIDATTEDSSVSIAENTGLTITVPTTQQSNELVQYFRGIETSKNNVVWDSPEKMVIPTKIGNYWYYPNDSDDDLSDVVINSIWKLERTLGKGQGILGDSLFSTEGQCVGTFFGYEYDPNGNGSNTFRMTRTTGLGWANIDRFFTRPGCEPASLVATVDDYEAYDDIEVYAIFKKDNVFLKPKGIIENKYSFTSIANTAYANLPVGQNVMLVAKAKKGDEYYFNCEEVRLTTKNEINMILELTDLTEVKRAIAQIIV